MHVPTFINFLGLGMAFPGEMKHLEHELKKIAGATVRRRHAGRSADRCARRDARKTSRRSCTTGASTAFPVVDADGKVVGIVARADIVRFIARTT